MATCGIPRITATRGTNYRSTSKASTKPWSRSSRLSGRQGFVILRFAQNDKRMVGLYNPVPCPLPPCPFDPPSTASQPHNRHSLAALFDLSCFETLDKGVFGEEIAHGFAECARALAVDDTDKGHPGEGRLVEPPVQLLQGVLCAPAPEVVFEGRCHCGRFRRTAPRC